MLAKICSDINKPNGQFELANNYDDIMKFLHDLPIRKVSGIGRVSEALLQACGINTVGELLERRAALKFCFSPLSQESFLRIALGLPGRPSASDPRRKSISVERTFAPTSSRDAQIEVMEEVCDMLVNDMEGVGVVGARCVTLKLKLSSFDVLTRSVTSARLVSTREEILSLAREIFERELPQEIRLLGIRLSNLQFADDRPADTTISVIDFWKRKQSVEAASSSASECSSSMTDFPTNPVPKSDEKVACPICNTILKNDDRVVNQHVDECLNSSLLFDSGSKTSLKSREQPKKREKTATIEKYFTKRKRE
ncbi:hypothetical protein DICVIV_12915 [Dictyocaulus viviparus]|uniref:DNA-directed DNA polymerase n=1 Tax=Dictyocaulus viviparus TaxID=29172 RepID=A0A0D8X947_DICVI|nr:hypothetical protein DICVIV_12915 [Dictyocaulus viviparus]